MPIAQDILGLLAFALLMAGQFAAVIAVHDMHHRGQNHADDLNSAAEPLRQAT